MKTIHPALLAATLCFTPACDDVQPDDPVTPLPDAAADAAPQPDAGGRDVGAPPADDFGEACTSGDECRSGFCVQVEGMARQCSRRCGNDDDCPDLWACQQVTNPEADVTFICVPTGVGCAGVDLQADVRHCGACDNACDFPGAQPLCVEGECAPGDCLPGFHDLDADAANGCEYACTVTREGVEACDDIDNDCDGTTDEGFDLQADPAHCGACGQACRPANATGACVEGACAVEACAAGFVDADGAADNGCELGCAPSNGGVEACDGIDNDCDMALDEGFDLQADAAHCGACNRPCALANADSTCAEGACRLDACRPGFADLDGVPATGCEYGCAPSNGGVERCDAVDNDCDGAVDEAVDTSADPMNCGQCGRSCVRPNALVACEAGACRSVGCADGFVDLNAMPADGCEYGCRVTFEGVERCDTLDNDCDGWTDEGFDLQRDPEHCGECGNRCLAPGGVPVCRQGVCGVEDCEAGFVDLDGDPDNGCEYACVRAGAEVCNGADDDCDGASDEGFDLDTDPSHCGRCGRACSYDNAAPLCADGLCSQGPCVEGFVDVNGRPDDGCEYACTPTADPTEVCDGQDNDCDGATDEGFDLQSSLDNCGTCGARCAPANADGLCAAGQCRVDECSFGFVDVDRDVANGCECERANKGIEACNTRDDDCDGAVDEGFDFRNDPAHCGGCGRRCVLPNVQTPLCALGACDIADCVDGFEDGDGDPANGCEVDCAATPMDPACGGAPPMFDDYPGDYTIAPRVLYSCSDLIFGQQVVTVNMPSVRFFAGGGLLLVTGAPVDMEQQPVPGDGSFRVQGVIPGDCAETYILQGQFDLENPDEWSGTFSIRFQGLTCGLTTCANQTYQITGTRQ